MLLHLTWRSHSTLSQREENVSFGIEAQDCTWQHNYLTGGPR